MFLLPIKLDRVSFETKGRQNLQKTADFLIESIVFCPHLQLNRGMHQSPSYCITPRWKLEPTEN